MCGHGGLFLVRKFMDDRKIKDVYNDFINDITNMSDISKANPHGCDNVALTDRFGILIQGLLAIVAFSRLMCDPPQAAAWLGQCGVYLLIMVLEKAVISLVLLIPGWSKLQEVLLSYIANSQLELVLVILIEPFIVNAVMFWVVDSLMMRKFKTMKGLDDSFDDLLKKADSLLWVNSAESRVLLTVDTDTDEASEGEEDPREGGSPSQVQFSGGPLRPSWVVV